MSAWTDEKVADLRALWPVMSATRIAKTLGDGITRNAVIGKAHRLHLPPKMDGDRRLRLRRAHIRAGRGLHK